MADNQVNKVFSVSIASGITLTSAIDLTQGFSEISLHVPTFASGTDLFIQAAIASGATYSRVTFPSINSATATTNDYEIASGVGDRFVPIPTNYQHLKIELSTQQTDTTSTFNVICKS